MLGMGSFEMALVFILCIAATLICVLYGIVNWNKTGLTSQEMRDQVEWAKKDRDFEDSVS